MRKIKGILKTLRRKIILFFNSIRVHFPIDHTGKFPRLVLPESWKKWVSGTLFVINVISWFTWYLTVESKLIGVLISAGFSLLLWLIGRNLFYYKSVVDFAYPVYETDYNRWTGLTFGLLPNVAPYIGFICTDEDYARELHSRLTFITGGQTRDVSAFLSVSVILLENGSYIFYCLPKLDNPAVQQFHQQIEDDRRRTTDLHMRHFRLIPLGMTVVNPSRESEIFFERYRPEYPLILMFFVEQNSELVQVMDLDWITLSTIKVCLAEELTPQDIEYSLIDLYGTYEEEARDNP